MDTFISFYDTIATLFLSKQGFYAILFGFVPMFLWIYFFNTQHKERLKYVITVFIAGMISVLPIKFYESIWNKGVFFLEHTSLLTSLSTLAGTPTVAHLVSFLVMSLIVSLGLYLFTMLTIGLLEVLLLGENKLKVYKHKVIVAFETPFLFVGVGLIIGVVAFFLTEFIPNMAWFFVVVGMLEEFIKHLVLRFSSSEKIRNTDDAMAFAIIVALGFAGVENVIYFIKFFKIHGMDTSMLPLFIILRSVVSVLAHCSFSGILGYFYGVARFTKKEDIHQCLLDQHWCRTLFHRILHIKYHTLFHEEKMMEGLLLAILLHTIFNILLELNMVVLAIPFIFGLFALLIHLYHRKHHHERHNTLVHRV